MTKELEDRVAQLERELRQKERQPSPKNYRAIVVILGISLVSIGTYAYLYGGTLRNERSISVIPENIIASTDFPLYYPQSIPQGFSLEAGSFQSNSEFVSFSLVANDGKTLLVVQQPDAEAFNPSELALEKQSETRIGSSYLTELNHRPTGIITADKTMITISSSSPKMEEEVKSLMKGF